MKALLCIWLTPFLLGGGVNSDLPGFAVKRIDKTINALWPETVISKKSLNLTAGQKNVLSFKLKDNELFTLQSNGKLLGYMWLSQSKGKFDNFNYMVIFNPDLSVKRTRVLVYREDYGGEISSKRWLAQFENKTKGQGMEYSRDIQAISGATISSRSICHGIKTLSLRLHELKQKGLLD